MMLIDFTDCEVLPHRAYSGANGKKIAIRYCDDVYMLKFPPSGETKPTALSYTNSCISEHIACSIFNMLGIRAQQTILGTFRRGGVEKIVCACKDFTEGGNRFFDFCSIKNTVLDSDSNGSGTELCEITDAIEKQNFVDSTELLQHFWKMFVVDALLGNFDRHNGNWGFLANETLGSVSIAPVYDCGSCLLPQADESVMRKVLANQAEMHARIFQFPTSAIKLGGRKINYYDFISRKENSDCMRAIAELLPLIDMSKIEALIDSVSCINDLQREFYKSYIYERHRVLFS